MTIRGAHTNSSEANAMGTFRLLTRSDFDGLVCAVLMKHLDLVDEIAFVHPKDVQDGKVEVTGRDILTNLPYVPACHLCFDHHGSEEVRNAGPRPTNLVLDASADSAASVVYRHFGGASRFPGVSGEMLEAVDRADSARWSIEDVLQPKRWALLSFLMDARTGLGRFRTFRISNYDLMIQLIEACREHPIERILELPDVQERVDLYRAHEERFQEQLRRCSTVHGRVVVLDLRDEETIWCGNRFVIYALHPRANVSIHVLWGLKRQNTVFAMGKSIFDRSNTIDIGALALEYGGGGHAAAGTCQIDNDDAERVAHELIDRLGARAACRAA